MQVWVIKSMGRKARLCISIDKQEVQLLIGSKILEEEELFTKLLVKAEQITIDLKEKNKPG